MSTLYLLHAHALLLPGQGRSLLGEERRLLQKRLMAT
jgi:hypothetical protein